MAASFRQHENVGKMAVVPDGLDRSRGRDVPREARLGFTAIAKALGIGRASVYRVLEVVR
jgi:hypothetical protein